jgi:hypothetical protein
MLHAYSYSSLGQDDWTDPASDVTGRPVGPEDWTGHRRDALAGLVRAVLR